MPPVPSELLIIGVGLIGGSLALGLKAADPGLKIVGAGRRVETLKKALEMGAIDRYDTDIAAAAATADMVMLAVPMTAMRPLLETIYPVLKKAAVVTDAGSVKGSFIKETKQIFGDLHNVVPGHPIAGNENSGIDAAFSTLFENRRVILTPTAETSAAAVQQVERLWRLCNANVEVMDADEHDRVLAATSHLPHVLSYSLVDTLLSCPEREAIFRYAAGGFRDFTRIASSDPVMWRDICLSNRECLLSMIDRLQINLQGLRKLISRADGEALQEIFSRTKKARDEHYE